MGIRERLQRLEAAQRAPVRDDRHLRPIFQLEGQTEEEAQQLSEFAGEPIERCAVVTEATLRRLFMETDGDNVLLEPELAEIRAKQDARRVHE